MDELQVSNPHRLAMMAADPPQAVALTTRICGAAHHQSLCNRLRLMATILTFGIDHHG